MFSRYCFRALGLMCLLLPIAGCTNTQVDSLSVTPTTQSLAAGQTAQLTATGTISHGSHPSSTENVTDQVAWLSNAPAVATVSSTGLVSAVSPGTASITATLPGLPPATATITVTGTSTTTTGGTVTTLSIIPSSQAVASPSQTTQFIAIGTTSTQATEDLTSQVIWSSSNPQVGTITSTGGLATAVGQGTTTITAIFANGTSGTVATGTATFTVTGGNAEQYTALTITPASQSVSSGGEAQFLALGTAGNTGLQEDITNKVTWTTSISTIAAFGAAGSAAGQVTGLSAGTTAVTALFTNPDTSVVTATGSVTVTSAAPPEPLLSLSIIPSSITVDQLQDTGNFLAIGTFSTVPYVRDLTNSVTWLSSAPTLFPVSTDNTTVNPGAPGGLVTAVGNGDATIIAEATASDGTIQTATATFSCPYLLPAPPQPGTCFLGSQITYPLSTLTIYNEGLNTTSWEVTAPSATGTPDVIHCGPGWSLNGGAGGSVCTASYPSGTTLILTAPTGTGQFGGWSSNCAPVVPINAVGPNSCTITLGDTTATGTAGVNQGNSNVSVGAIFN
jgi:uncharacterized protein YjdB